MKNQQDHSKPNLGEHELQWEKNRLRQLMDGFVKTLEKIEANPSPKEIKALYGEGFKVHGEPVISMVYIFETQHQHQEARKKIENYMNKSFSDVITASNGRLFFWGYIKENNPKAVYTLNDLASAFAGEE